MKKVKLDKLSLNRMAVARLQHDELHYLHGGRTAYGATCGTASSGDGYSCRCSERSAGPGCVTSCNSFGEDEVSGN